jgi:hypothetical protein
MAQQQSPCIGALSGAAGGIVGAFAMTALELLFDRLHSSPAPCNVRDCRKEVDGTILRDSKPERESGDCLRRMLRFVLRNDSLICYPKGEFSWSTYMWPASQSTMGSALLLEQHMASVLKKLPRLVPGHRMPLGVSVWLLAEELALP